MRALRVCQRAIAESGAAPSGGGGGARREDWQEHWSGWELTSSVGDEACRGGAGRGTLRAAWHSAGGGSSGPTQPPESLVGLHCAPLTALSDADPP